MDVVQIACHEEKKESSFRAPIEHGNWPVLSHKENLSQFQRLDMLQVKLTDPRATKEETIRKQKANSTGKFQKKISLTPFGERGNKPKNYRVFRK